MWVPWVVEGLKIIMVWSAMEYLYGGEDWETDGFCYAR